MQNFSFSERVDDSGKGALKVRQDLRKNPRILDSSVKKGVAKHV